MVLREAHLALALLECTKPVDAHHPCFKIYDFIDDFDLISTSEKEWALRELRTEWRTVWKPKQKEPEAGTSSDDVPDPVPSPVPLGPVPTPDICLMVEPPKKQRKVTLGGLLGGRVKKEPAAPAPKPEQDALEEYLLEPEETDLDLNVLVWWQAKETKWPALAKMVKQYFAAPAFSAGVERVFSAVLERCTATFRSRPRTQPSNAHSLRPSTLTEAHLHIITIGFLTPPQYTYDTIRSFL